MHTVYQYWAGVEVRDVFKSNLYLCLGQSIRTTAIETVTN